MSTYSKLRDLQNQYQEELNTRKEDGKTGDNVKLLERIVKDLGEVSTYASWSEFPEDMGR